MGRGVCCFLSWKEGDSRRKRGGVGGNSSPQGSHEGEGEGAASAEQAEPSQASPPSHTPRLALPSPQGSYTLALTALSLLLPFQYSPSMTMSV